MRRIIKVFIIMMILLMAFYNSTHAQEIRNIGGKQIYLVDDAHQSLAEKMKQAESRFSRECRGEYFLTGYHFDARSNARVSGNYIGSSELSISKIFREGDRIRINQYGHIEQEEDSESMDKGERILIVLNKKKGTGAEITDITVLNRDYSYGIENLPLFWLGKIPVSESFMFLKTLFGEGASRLSKAVVAAIAFHDHPQSMDFMFEVASGDRYQYGIRKSAIFWMGAIKDKAGLDYLLKLNSNILDGTLRKHWVFALYLQGSPGAIKELIKTAKNDTSRSIRKKAIFWLGQKASKECVAFLKDVVENEEEESVKSSAVFAISQLHKTRAVPMLIQIARGNKNPKIRRKAIFWLGEIGDEQAIQFFEEILLK